MGGNKTVLSTKSEVGDETIKFRMRKNMEIDEFKRFKEVLENEINIMDYNNYLDVDIKAFFTPKCVESYMPRN